MGKEPASEKSAWASKSAKPTTGARRSVHLFPPLPNLGREPEQASTEHKDRYHYQLPRNGMGMRPSKLDVNEYGSGRGQCGGANQRDDTSHNAPRLTLTRNAGD